MHNMIDIKVKVFQTIHQVFGKNFSKELLTAEETEEWDSLNHIKLIMDLEKIFNIRFNPAEITNLYTNSDVIVRTIKEKIG